MHRNMLKIQDGVAIVEKLNCTCILAEARMISTNVLYCITLRDISSRDNQRTCRHSRGAMDIQTGNTYSHTIKGKYSSSFTLQQFTAFFFVSPVDNRQLFCIV